MKKFLTLALSAFMLIATLTSCVAEDIGIKLNKDGTGSVALTVGIKEDYYDMMTGADGNSIFDGKETTEVTIDGEKYISVTESTEYKSFDEIEKALLELTYNTDEYEDAVGEPAEEDDVIADSDMAVALTETEALSIFKSVEIVKNEGLFYTNYSFKATLNPMPKNAEYDFNDMMKLSITVEMPEKITQANGGTAEDKTVTFDIEDLTNETELLASAETNNYVVIISIVVVLVLVLALFFFLTKKRD